MIKLRDQKQLLTMELKRALTLLENIEVYKDEKRSDEMEYICYVNNRDCQELWSKLKETRRDSITFEQMVREPYTFGKGRV